MHDIDECWNGDVVEYLEIDLYFTMTDYKNGYITNGDKYMSDSKELWDTALAGCGDIS